MGLRDLFRKNTDVTDVPHAALDGSATADASVEHDHEDGHANEDEIEHAHEDEHDHDHSHDDGCGPVGPPVPAEAVAQRVAPASESTPTDTVVLRSFALKLAVLQPLMYEPGAVLPAFSMPASMHPGRPVEDWFRGFTVTADQLARVDALSLSRTNEVYRQVDPHWPADDDRFDLGELTDRDLDALPSLRTVADPDGMLTPAARAALEARGITITDAS